MAGHPFFKQAPKEAAILSAAQKQGPSAGLTNRLKDLERCNPNSAVASSGPKTVELVRAPCAFSQKRLQAYVDAWITISKCKTLSDLSEYQLELATKVTSQHMEAESAIIKRYTT